MAQIYSILHIDVKVQADPIVKAVQWDSNSRFIDAMLLDNGIPIDLTGHTVRIYARKPDGHEIFNDGEILDAVSGKVRLPLTDQTLAAMGKVEANIIIYKDNVEILTTMPFGVWVVKNIYTDHAIESSNEYDSLVVFFQNLTDAYQMMEQVIADLEAMMAEFGSPGAEGQGLGLDTFYKYLDYMIYYLRVNSSAGIVEKVDTINSKIGTSTDGIDVATLFGKLNKGAVKSVQRGFQDTSSQQYANVTSQPTDVFTNPIYRKQIPISSINTGKSMVSTVPVGTFENRGVAARIEAPTTISIPPNTFNYNTSTDTLTVTYYPFEWQVIEFN